MAECKDEQKNRETESSSNIKPTGTDIPRIWVYEHPNYKGQKKEFLKTGSDNLRGEPAPGLSNNNWNDEISSIVVLGGTWELFHEARHVGKQGQVDFRGGHDNQGLYQTVSSWNGSGEKKATENSISSLRPMK